MVVAGSSPRVRGKLLRQIRTINDTRIIPASAGQTWRTRTPPPRRSDHPRECGANSAVDCATAAALGSSPRVRGKRALVRAAVFCVRGSSPRVRGKLASSFAMIFTYRIIPASAGQTGHGHGTDQSQSGSSPRVRGKLRDSRCRVLAARIIPASAGQTKPRSDAANHSADHPRECGANTAVSSSCAPHEGSSPRVRGKHFRVGVLRRIARIIPASAGQTSAVFHSIGARPDHPRECGANSGIGTIR